MAAGERATPRPLWLLQAGALPPAGPAAVVSVPEGVRMSPDAASDRFAAKRAAMREEFLARHFLLGGWPGGTDTYKRTMWAAVPDVALAHAGYALTMRKPLPEPGANNQLIMAGHEAMLAQWFHRPLRRGDIELAASWSERHAAATA